MRIAVVHNFYRSVLPSGENRVVQLQVDGLRARGHEVLLVRADSDSMSDTPVSLVRTAVQVARHGGLDPSPELNGFAPDVVHVHNLFPNFSYHWLARWRGPLVATLHNYRSVCANAVLSRDGHLCTLCPDGSRLSALRYRCYRDSLAGTIPMAWRTRHGVEGDPLLQRADRLIVLSESTRNMFHVFGIPKERMALIPNGVPDPGLPTQAMPPVPPRFAAVGRLSSEKGFAGLLRGWPPGAPLDIVGDGPEVAKLRAIAPPGVRFLGLVPHEQFLKTLGDYSGVVVPGANPEGGYPMVTAEALAAGVPLIAREGGVVAPMVKRWGGGVTYQDDGDLGAALERAILVPRSEARAVYDSHFTESGWLDGLMDVYRRAGAQNSTP